MSVDNLAVQALIREVAAEHILPRFRSLTSEQIEEKSKGDFVTIADQQAEAALTPRLRDLLPGSLVIGEEAAAADGALLARAGEAGPQWIVDPIDGTSLFVAGDDGFAVMVALVNSGEVRASWIYFPARDDLFAAERGGGAFRVTTAGEKRLSCAPTVQPGAARICLYTSHFPEGSEAKIEALAATYGIRNQHACSAQEYTKIATGQSELALFHRMLPWDHAPGSLILSEAGGLSRRLDDHRTYEVARMHGPHLLAASEELWKAGAAAFAQA